MLRHPAQNPCQPSDAVAKLNFVRPTVAKNQTVSRRLQTTHRQRHRSACATGKIRRNGYRAARSLRLGTTCGSHTACSGPENIGPLELPGVAGSKCRLGITTSTVTAFPPRTSKRIPMAKSRRGQVVGRCTSAASYPRFSGEGEIMPVDSQTKHKLVNTATAESKFGFRSATLTVAQPSRNRSLSTRFRSRSIMTNIGSRPAAISCGRARWLLREALA